MARKVTMGGETVYLSEKCGAVMGHTPYADWSGFLDEVEKGLGVVATRTMPQGREAATTLAVLRSGGWVGVADSHRKAGSKNGTPLGRKWVRLLSETDADNKSAKVCLIGVSVELQAGHSMTWGALTANPMTSLVYRDSALASLRQSDKSAGLGDVDYFPLMGGWVRFANIIDASDVRADCGCPKSMRGYLGTFDELSDNDTVVTFVGNAIGAFLGADSLADVTANTELWSLVTMASVSPMRQQLMPFRSDNEHSHLASVSNSAKGGDWSDLKGALGTF